MAESKKLVTKNHRLHIARQMIESINEPANTAYYVFLGNHLEYASTLDANVNSSTGISNSTDYITTSSPHNFANGYQVQYITSKGNTAITGLTNASSYYVRFANSTAFKLSTTLTGSVVDLTSAVTGETGHIFRYTVGIPQPNDSIFEVSTETYKNMIYGKRIAPNDIKLMIPRNDYVSNKVYDMYDDTAGEQTLQLFNKNYYAVVNADAYYHVFKCLDNNQGSNSTVKPEFSEVDAEDEIYLTSDGYAWKYMYTVDSTTVSKFATSDYFPLVANNIVSASARDGTIDVIKVEVAGRGYDNYCNGTFRVDDLRIGGNPSKYSINSSLTANTTSAFYNGCYLYISAGTGVGQYQEIIDYTVNSTVKAVTLRNEFPIPPQSDSRFEINPGVRIVGDGGQSINAVARAIINSAGNTVQRVEMLSVGLGYKFATANVYKSSVVGVTKQAQLRPIFPPPGGHGYDAAAELGSTRVGVSIKFSNMDVGIPLTNDYRTIGILKDPVFANVTINYTNATSSFVADETIYKISGVRICDNATVNTTSSVVLALADFENQLDVGEYIYITDNTNYQLTTVNSIVNSSYITIKSNAFFDSTGSVSIYKTMIGTTVSNLEFSTANLTGNLVTNSSFSNVYGKGTSFSTELLPNTSLYIYANSTGAGEIRKINSIVVNSIAFNVNTDINNTTDFITISNNSLVNNDLIRYFTAAGNTALSGLSNNSYYYVVSANSTGIKLSTTRGGSASNLTASSTSENGHYLAIQKLIVSSNMSFTNTDAKAQILNYTIQSTVNSGIESTTGYVTSVSTGSLIASNVAGVFKTGDMIIGSLSGATGVISSIERSGITKGFESFVQMYKYIGTPISGTFDQDELLYQSPTGDIIDAYANARMHSVTGAGPTTNYFVTNQIGIFNVGSNMIGNNNGATAYITGKYSPELVFGSGEVMYLEKIEPIARSNTTSETIKFIFDF